MEHLVIDSNIIISYLVESDSFHQTALPYVNGLESGDYTFHASMLVPVEVAGVAETTALGAAFLAGRGIGLWRSENEISSLWQPSARYEPSISESERANLYAGWLDAIRRSSTTI